MRQLIWSRPAQRDLLTITDHYDAIDPDLTDSLLQHIAGAPLILLEHPHIGAPTDWPGVRKWRVRGAPFLLFYLVRRGQVEIARIRHAAEDWTRS